MTVDDYRRIALALPEATVFQALIMAWRDRAPASLGASGG
jgi:hypothetical protein